MRLLAWIIASLVGTLGTPTARTAPFITITAPLPGGYPVNYVQNIRVEFCEASGWFDMTGIVYLDGSPIGYGQAGSKAGCSDFQYWEGGVTLANASQTISAFITSSSGTGEESVVYVTPPTAPGISAAAHNGYFIGMPGCVMSCFNVVTSYSTPAYYSLDIPRSVTLQYSSGSVTDLHTVVVDAWNQAAITPNRITLQLKKPNGSLVTFANGSTELYFFGVDSLRRLAAQFRDSTLTSGAHNYTAVVRGYWDGTPYENTTPVRVLVINHRTSPYGAGWSVVGIPRMAGSSDSLSIVDGSTAISFWGRSGCSGVGGLSICNYTPPPGAFDSLKSCNNCSWKYLLRQVDGTTLSFDPTGNLYQVSDPFSNTTNIYWRDAQRIDSIVDPAGKKIRLYYNGSTNRLDSIVDVPGQRRTTITINSSNDLTAIRDPAGGYPFQGTYDAAHRLQSAQDRRGATWLYRYDFAGKLSRDSTPAVLVDDNSTPQRLGTRYASPWTSLLLDPGSSEGSSGSPASPRAPIFAATVTPPGQSATRGMLLDVFGLLIRVNTPFQSYAVYTRNGHGQLVSVADSTGSASYTWSGPRLLTETNNVTQQTVTNEWNATYHRVTRRYGGGGPDSRAWVGTNGRIDSTKVGSDPTATFTYDSRGRIAASVDPRAHTSTYYRATTSFLNTDSVMASGRTSGYRYDSFGRRVATISPAGHRDSTVYDVLNRVTGRFEPTLPATTFTFGDSLNVTRITDPKGQVFDVHRNLVGWDTAVVDPNGYRDRYAYTAAGLVMRWTNRRGQANTFSYDTLGRMLGRALSTAAITEFSYGQSRTIGSNSEGSDTLRISGDTSFAIAVRNGYPYTVRTRYQSSTRELRVAVWRYTDTPLETKYTLDTAGRVQAILPPYLQADSVRHNSDGQLSTMDIHGSSSMAHAYRPTHRLARFAYGPSGLQSAFGTEFIYDSEGRIIERRNGTRTQIERYAYDGLGRLFTFHRYDASTACDTTNTAHQTGSLCGSSLNLIVSDTFTYDSAGNRRDGGAIVDTGNRQRSLDGYSFDYDADGNLTRKYKANDTLHLYWNSANQLDSARRYTGSWTTVRFGYDAFGRRVRKTTNSTTIRYVWSGNQVVAEYDGSGNYQRGYTYYPGTDRPHSISNAVRYVATDGLTNVTGDISTTGGVAAFIRYRPFGEIDSAYGTPVSALRFAGRELDTETGLYYNRARYYDPQAGRFISEDPIGLAGGLNRYTFAANDPVNARDPSGNACEYRVRERTEATLMASSSEPGEPYLHCWDDWSGGYPVYSFGGADWGAFHDWGPLFGGSPWEAHANAVAAAMQPPSREVIHFPGTGPASPFYGCKDDRVIHATPPAVPTGQPGPTFFDRPYESMGVSVNLTYGPNVDLARGVNANYRGTAYVIFPTMPMFGRYDLAGRANCLTGEATFNASPHTGP